MAIYDYQGNVIAVGGGESPLAGKKICLIGDSNTQYSGNLFKSYFEETYGCSFTPLGYAGAAWENTETTSDYSAVGRVNTLIAGADESTKLCSDYDYVLIMMGTNCTNVGTVEDTSETLTTMCGAVRYCLEKLLYYYRKSKIGVILPPQRNLDNEYQIERNNLIQQICEEYAVATLDMQRRGQIVGDSKLGESSFYLSDGLHFGANGVVQFQETVGKWIAYGMQGGSTGGSSDGLDGDIESDANTLTFVTFDFTTMTASHTPAEIRASIEKGDTVGFSFGMDDVVQCTLDFVGDSVHSTIEDILDNGKILITKVTIGANGSFTVNEVRVENPGLNNEIIASVVGEVLMSEEGVAYINALIDAKLATASIDAEGVTF